MTHRPKVLVVDSDKNILSAFKNYLKKKRYSITCVNNIHAGLKKIRAQNFNLLITDIRENSEFGINFVSQAKAIQCNLPIIAITSFPDKITESDLKNYGANYLLVKPLELSKLDEAIENCLRTKVK